MWHVTTTQHHGWRENADKLSGDSIEILSSVDTDYSWWWYLDDILEQHLTESMIAYQMPTKLTKEITPQPVTANVLPQEEAAIMEL